MIEQELKRVRGYIASVEWRFAKTYAATAPHEYTVRKWNPHLEVEFANFVLTIREHGYVGSYGNRRYTYLDLDGFKYWTMGAPVGQTIVINRSPLDGRLEDKEQ